jgi:hypothetical protein
MRRLDATAQTISRLLADADRSESRVPLCSVNAPGPGNGSPMSATTSKLTAPHSGIVRSVQQHVRSALERVTFEWRKALTQGDDRAM